MAYQDLVHRPLAVPARAAKIALAVLALALLAAVFAGQRVPQPTISEVSTGAPTAILDWRGNSGSLTPRD